MEAKEENRKGPQEMEEALAVGQINSCPPTTPRYLRLDRASRHSVEPHETSPCRSSSQSAEGHVKMYQRLSVVEMGMENKRW